MNEPLRSTRGDILVIGYGNTIRGDDAAGPIAAEAVAARCLPGVVALAVHQLTPELAEPLAASRLAIFADARLAGDGEEMEARPVEPFAAGTISGHLGDPRCLLALARAAYGSHPRAWWVTVPATNFEPGISLSPTAERGLDAALGRIVALACDVESRPGIGSQGRPRHPLRRSRPWPEDPESIMPAHQDPPIPLSREEDRSYEEDALDRNDPRGFDSAPGPRQDPRRGRSGREAIRSRTCHDAQGIQFDGELLSSVSSNGRDRQRRRRAPRPVIREGCGSQDRGCGIRSTGRCRT